jgi:hypothetical protein
MTETETKIVQLLKSDEDCNKILGLILGRNELGVSRLLNVISRFVRRKGENNVSEVRIIDTDNNVYTYTIYHSMNNLHRLFRNGTSAGVENFGEDRMTRFNNFLKLTIDDNI